MANEARSNESSGDARTRTWIEEIEIAGGQLIDRIQDLVRDGNAKRVIIRTKDGAELMTVPLTFGVVAGGLITMSAPVLAAVGAVAGLVTRVKLEIEREEPVAAETAPEAPPAQPDRADPRGGDEEEGARA